MKKNYLSINQSINQSINNRSLGKKIFPILFITLLLIISSCILISCENPWMRELIEELEKKRDRDRERKNKEDNKGDNKEENKEQIKVFTNVEDLNSWLLVQSNGIQTADPVKFALKIPFGTMPDSNWYALLDALDAAGKYVDIDLSGCTMSDTVFDPDYNIATGKDKIVSLVLPDQAKTIEDGTATSQTFLCFDNLANVSGINITTIGTYAFGGSFGLSNLANMSFPAAITIGVAAFYNCTALTNVSLPVATNIGGSAFSGCTALTSVNLPSVTDVAQSAFRGSSSLQIVNLPMVTTIGDMAFMDNVALQSVSLPAATTIGIQSFATCTALRNIDISMAISIGTRSFLSTGDGSLFIKLGSVPPSVGTTMFAVVTVKTVTLHVPLSSASVYNAWESSFKGGNAGITIVYQYY